MVLGCVCVCKNILCGMAHAAEPMKWNDSNTVITYLTEDIPTFRADLQFSVRQVGLFDLSPLQKSRGPLVLPNRDRDWFTQTAPPGGYQGSCLALLPVTPTSFLGLNRGTALLIVPYNMIWAAEEIGGNGFCTWKGNAASLLVIISAWPCPCHPDLQPWWY